MPPEKIKSEGEQTIERERVAVSTASRGAERSAAQPPSARLRARFRHVDAEGSAHALSVCDARSADGMGLGASRFLIRDPAERQATTS